jgi:ribokinase
VLALRRGAAGADVWDLEQGRGVFVPAVQTEVVDVVGAGNAFCGALVARLADGLDEAACHASAAASYLIEQVGLPPSLPDPADYARRLDEARAGRWGL